MNFNKHGVSKKMHMLKSTTVRLSSKIRVISFNVLLIGIVALFVIGCYSAFGVVKGICDTAPSTDNINVLPTSYKTYVYYSDGTISDTIAGAEANREYVTIDKIPKHVQHAFVALEDERFYEHDGIDVRGIFRALYSDIVTLSLDYGASTITQQLLKNQVLGGGNESSAYDAIVRKIQEQYLAIYLDAELDKDTILEYYLNNLNLGNGSWGIQTAAQNYFGKDVWELTLSEASVLAPLAYSPVYQNPINYPHLNAERREKCLTLMVKAGFITQEECDEALADDVYSRLITYHEERGTSSPYSYFLDELIDHVIDDLIKYCGYTEAEASSMLYTKGLHIYTTQDREIQEIVDDIYTDETYFPALGKGSYYELEFAYSVHKPDGTKHHYHLNDFIKYFENYYDANKLYYHKDGTRWGISNLCIDYDDLNAKIEEFKASVTEEGDTTFSNINITLQPQSSMFIIEQSTGKVVALYGGRGKKEASLVLNRATDTLRQVGSTFKVLAAFLPALDSAGLSLATVYDDCQYFYPGTSAEDMAEGIGEVTNWYHNYYRGLQSIRSGISSSLNVIAVKAIEEVTPAVAFKYLEKLGFTTLVESTTINGQKYSDINLPLALGGLTKGVSNAELTTAYAAIANAGVYQEPIYYTKILDHDGNVLIERKSESTQVIKRSTAWLLTSAMLDTVATGTGTAYAFNNYNMPVAGKTGTASGANANNDLWFVGYTPYYTAGIWSGFDNNFAQTDTSYQKTIWRIIMERTHSKKALPYKTFEVPDSIITADICTKCGKLAIVGICDKALSGNCIKTEYFAKGVAPTEKCTCHVKVSVCSDSNHIACKDCPVTSVKEVIYLIKDESGYYIPPVEQPETPTTGTLPGVTPTPMPTPTPHKTWDTPYIFPTGEDGVSCPVHSKVTPTPSPSPTPVPPEVIEPVTPPDENTNY